VSTQLSQFQTLASPRNLSSVSRIGLRSQWTILRFALLSVDFFMLMAAFKVAYWIRFEVNLSVSPEVIASQQYYFSISVMLAAACLSLFAIGGLYRFENLLGGTWEYSKLLNACTFAFLSIVVLTFAMPTFIIARGWVFGGWLLAAFFVTLGRFLIRRVAYALRNKGYFLVRAAIVGINSEARALAEELSDWRASGVELVGHVVETVPSQASGATPVIGHLDDLERLIEEHEIRDLIVAMTALNRDQLLTLCELINPLSGVNLRLSSGLFEVLTTRVRVKNLGWVPCVSLEKIRLNVLEQSVKAVFDFGLSLLGLIALSPLLLLLALLVKIDSPGPVLHRRRVLGMGGKPFDAFKFRTMYVNGDEILARHPEQLLQLREEQKLKDDPRVTRLGQWLRKTSLDELPQLFNVLMGQMSLVGPRMISPEEGEKYGRLKLSLLTVKPGITGLWQVSGRSNLSYEERVRLDIHYVRYYSVWTDLQILFVQTLPAVLKSRGAY
jgi:exopolysaccharide biosynthesis polyprenyl glycosylphosphotransferase